MKKIRISITACLMAGLMSTSSFAGIAGHGVSFSSAAPNAGQNAVQSTQQTELSVRAADALGKWNADAKGWWWRNPDGTWPKNTWAWLDGNKDGVSECYYFGADGYMLASTTTPDGYPVNKDGAWVNPYNGVKYTKGGSTVTAKKTSSHDDDDEDDDESSSSTKTYSSGGSSSSSPFDAEEWEDEVIDLVNKERRKKGLDELEKYDTLMDVAELRAEEAGEKFSHTRPDGTSCFTAFDEAGFNEHAAAGENLGEGYTSPKDVMNGWMNSSGHKANILSKKFTRIGVGVYKKGSTYYWAQAFGGDDPEWSSSYEWAD